jgi:hypothetical protein
MRKFAEVVSHSGAVRHTFEWAPLDAEGQPLDVEPVYSPDCGLEAVEITAVAPQPQEGWVRSADGTFSEPHPDAPPDLMPPSIPLDPETLARQSESDPVGALDWLNDPANVKPEELAALRANVWGGLLVQALAVEDFSNLQKLYVKLKETAREPLSGDRVLYFGKEFLTLLRLPLQP